MPALAAISKSHEHSAQDPKPGPASRHHPDLGAGPTNGMPLFLLPRHAPDQEAYALPSASDWLLGDDQLELEPDAVDLDSDQFEATADEEPDAPATDGEEALQAESPPNPRQAIAPAIAAVHNRSAAARRHRPSGVLVGSAQSAAIDPQTEQVRGAATLTVTRLDEAKTQEVRRTIFKQKLKDAIDKATPHPESESQAKRVMETGATEASSALHGELAAERDVAAGPLKATTAKEVQPGEITTQKKTALEAEEIGPPPAPVPARFAVPEPLASERLDYSSDREPSDALMAEHDIDRDQLEKGAEPEFDAALEARGTAEQHESTVEARYRASESGVRDQAHGMAHQALEGGLTGIHGERVLQIGSVIEEQLATQSKDELERRRVTDDVQRIKDNTRAAVETILTDMESRATDIFETGLRRAEKAYRNTFEEVKGGIGTWLTTWGSDWERLIERSLRRARVEYLRQVDVAIDEVADLVEASVTLAKERVAEGLQQVEQYVEGLDDSVREYGEEALREVEADFDAMVTGIDARRDGLVDRLADQYKASYERMSAMEEELREANKSLWQRVYDATVGLVKKILAFKDMLLGILGKAAGVIRDIISDPIGFLKNLVSGIMQGLRNFMAKIGAHLQKGLMDWLLGAFAGTGLRLPEKFDLPGIASLVLQILGITYDRFRARAVKLVGEPVVAALEKAAEIFRIVRTEGVAGLWRFIKEKLLALKSMVLDPIYEFIKERVIIAGVTWIIGLLNPASAFFKACKAIYDIVTFFINKGRQIAALVNAIVDSIASIAKGALGTAIGLVEGALAKAIPVAIGFLASLLNLGDPAAPVRKAIDSVRALVDQAIDWVINQAVRAVKAIGGLFGGKDKEQPETDDPEHDAKVAAGLADIDREEKHYAQDGRVSEEHAIQVATTVKKQNPIFKKLVPKAGDKRWRYEWSASPGSEHVGAHERIGNFVLRNIREDIPPDLRTKLDEAGPDWLKYEEAAVFGVTKNILVPEWEEEIGIPIRMTHRGGLRSRQDEARLRVQRGHRTPGIGSIRPEGTMEVMVPRGRGAVQSVYKVEATLKEDYSVDVAKMNQLYDTGATIKAKYGTTIPVQYHILCPRQPSLETVNEVNEAIDRIGIPNVTVVWNVTG
jgi:hypothetical protein